MIHIDAYYYLCCSLLSVCNRILLIFNCSILLHMFWTAGFYLSYCYSCSNILPLLLTFAWFNSIFLIELPLFDYWNILFFCVIIFGCIIMWWLWLLILFMFIIILLSVTIFNPPSYNIAIYHTCNQLDVSIMLLNKQRSYWSNDTNPDKHLSIQCKLWLYAIDCIIYY